MFVILFIYLLYYFFLLHFCFTMSLCDNLATPLASKVKWSTVMWVDASGMIHGECIRARVDRVFRLFWFANYNGGGFKVGWKSVSGRIWKSMCFSVNWFLNTNTLEHALSVCKSMVNKHDFMNLVSLSKKLSPC